MAMDPIGEIVSAFQAKLRGEMDAQIRAIQTQHEQALADLRVRIESEADERSATLLRTARVDAQKQLESAVMSARAELQHEHSVELAKVRDEAERRIRDEVQRARREVEMSSAETLARTRRDLELAISNTRRELEHALATERQLGQARIEAERRNAAEQLELAREAFDAERALLDHRPAGSAAAVLEAIRLLDGSSSVSETLEAIVRAAATGADRAALFLANGEQLDEWTVAGTPAIGPSAAPVGILDRALSAGAPVRSERGDALATPLLLDGQPVGVLYGEAGASGGSLEWDVVLETVARHGAAHLGYLTALRTAQARAWLANDGSRTATLGPLASDSEEEATARRYARLVVSEIKLYNEAAVRAGREQRDLMRRLGPEIERARRLYEDRVPPSAPQRAQHFHNELVQTLAGGDPSLLG